MAKEEPKLEPPRQSVKPEPELLSQMDVLVLVHLGSSEETGGFTMSEQRM